MKTKEIIIEVDEINLKGKLHLLKEKPLIVLCHGVPGSKQSEELKESEDGGYLALAKECVKRGFSTFHFNFRGTGESEGNFDLKGWTRDLKAILDYLEKENYSEGKRFFLWGFSAGAAVSTYVASQDDRIKGLALAACPANLEARFPKHKLGKIIEEFRNRGIIRDPEFPENSLKWLEDIYNVSPIYYINKIVKTPVFIVHGTEDELIPYSEAYDLYELTKAPKEICIIQGGKHQLRKNTESVDKCLEWFLTLV